MPLRPMLRQGSCTRNAPIRVFSPARKRGPQRAQFDGRNCLPGTAGCPYSLPGKGVLYGCLIRTTAAS